MKKRNITMLLEILGLIIVCAVYIGIIFIVHYVAATYNCSEENKTETLKQFKEEVEDIERNIEETKKEKDEKIDSVSKLNNDSTLQLFYKLIGK